jgi:hypothetical protein
VTSFIVNPTTLSPLETLLSPLPLLPIVAKPSSPSSLSSAMSHVGIGAQQQRFVQVRVVLVRRRVSIVVFECGFFSFRPLC